jgi:hypothetical protein
MSGDTLNATLYRGTAYYGTGPTTVRYYVSAVDWLGKGTDSPVETVEVRNDIAVTGLTVENSIVSGMNHVQASITLRNNGTLPLSFANVAVYANSTLVATYTVPDLRCNEDINLNTSLVLPKGNYIITAYAAGLPDEVDTSNNARMAGVYNRYDLALSAVAASKTVVGQDYPASVDIVVKNQGNFTETFNVTLYANTTFVALQTITLESGASITIIFTWNTTGFAKGNYTISAVADTVPGETDTADNNFTDGWVMVTRVGDLCGTGNAWDFVPDGVVDGSDLSIVAKCYGSWPGAQPPMIWNANCDVNDDGVVDGSDLAIVARHFGESDP